MRRIGRIAGLSTLLLATATPAMVQEADVQIPEFPVEVEAVAIDVTVVDKGGRPVRDLRTEDFEVEVEGQPRRIVSLEFVAAGGEPAEAAPGEPLSPGSSSHGVTTPGRLVLIAIDLWLVQPLGARFVTDAAGKLLDSLTPADRVGLVSFPPPGPSVGFTADREEVRKALKSVVGRSDLRRRRISLTEALSYTKRRDRHEWETALRRECRVTRGREAVPCVRGMESEAWQLAQELGNASRNSISTLRAIFDLLLPFEGSKSVVLISPGLHSERGGPLRELGVKAAESGVSLYALQLDQPVAGVASRSTRISLSKDVRLLSQGLDVLASLARGKVFRMVGSGERAFERIALELSGYYLLGIAPEPADRDGKVHDVRVKVAREDVEVRSRGVVRIPAPVGGLP
jgi:VWFA-related protein